MNAFSSRSNAITYRTIAHDIEREFPGVLVWYGPATRQWWAYVPTGHAARLVEAMSPEALRSTIITTRGRPWNR